MAEGNRILFAIPLGQRVILGTTDTDYAGAIEAVRTEAQDIRYILDVVNATFPGSAITETDLISDWAGLRPLIAKRDGSPSDISRAHLIRLSREGWLDMAGGKLTTYRLIAEQAVDRLVKYLGREVPPCRTHEEPLLDRAQTEGISALTPPPVSEAVVKHYCDNEWAVHLDDIMVRRARWQSYEPDADQIASQVAAWMGRHRGWDEATLATELARYRGQ